MKKLTMTKLSPEELFPLDSFSGNSTLILKINLQNIIIAGGILIIASIIVAGTFNNRLKNLEAEINNLKKNVN
jgi:hypothetical protein